MGRGCVVWEDILASESAGNKEGDGRQEESGGLEHGEGLVCM
jgi:hypothetical protein